jgi:3D (Asp-Asp-Asp) domain-containing protein
MADPFADLIPQSEAGQGSTISLPIASPTPVTTYSIPKSVGGADEMYDAGTARGVGSSENELAPGVVAVNPSVHPIGTIFKDADTNEVFIAGDKHGNKNPNVIDIYTPPSQYTGLSGSRNLVPIGQIPANQIPKTAKGVGELLKNYGKVPQGEGAYTSLGKNQQSDPFADLIPQQQGVNAPTQQQSADPFTDLIPAQQQQSQPNSSDAAYLTSPIPLEKTGKTINLPAVAPQPSPQGNVFDQALAKYPKLKDANGFAKNRWYTGKSIPFMLP